MDGPRRAAQPLPTMHEPRKGGAPTGLNLAVPSLQPDRQEWGSPTTRRRRREQSFEGPNNTQSVLLAEGAKSIIVYAKLRVSPKQAQDSRLRDLVDLCLKRSNHFRRARRKVDGIQAFLAAQELLDNQFALERLAPRGASPGMGPLRIVTHGSSS